MQNTETERNSWIKLIILFLYVLLLGVVTVAGSGGEDGLNFDNPNTIIILKVFQAVSVLLIFIFPALMFALFWTKSKIHYLGITTRPSIVTLLLAGTGIILASPLINWLGELNQHMKLPEIFSNIELWMRQREDSATVQVDAFMKGTSVGVLVLNLFVIAFMAAISEELFFRGILQKVIIECTRNKHIGVWLSAIIFSAFHMQFYGFIPRMLMGAFLSYLFLWSGSLWPGILAHFINNGMAVFLIWLANRGVISDDADKMGTEQGQWIYVLVSAVMVALSLFLVYRKEKKNTVVQEVV
jgi:membrane protease YdiL (CAAX protease family)